MTTIVVMPSDPLVVVADDQVLPVLVSQPPVSVITSGEGPKGRTGDQGPQGLQGLPAEQNEEFDPGDFTLIFENGLI